MQALRELFAVLTRKPNWPASLARSAALNWYDAYHVAGTSAQLLRDGFELAIAHQLGVWDAIMLAAAGQTRCHLFLSEDMQDGLTWRSVTIWNPFAASSLPELGQPNART